MTPESLADLARDAALAGRNITIELPADWERPHGFPFPALRPSSFDDTGYGVWEWHPAAVLRWVFDSRKPQPPQGTEA